MPDATTAKAKKFTGPVKIDLAKISCRRCRPPATMTRRRPHDDGGWLTPEPSSGVVPAPASQRSSHCWRRS